MKIIMLGTDCNTTQVIYNEINKHFEVSKIIIEQPTPLLTLAKRRAKKIGYFKVFGQIIFRLLVVPILKIKSKKRIVEIVEEYKLNTSFLPLEKIINVENINSEASISFITNEAADIIIVNGTRIISAKVLNAIGDTIIINTHLGITPNFRGSHGGYWALVKNEPNNFGITIHKVDTGIDTGTIVKQARALVNKDDNFVTYPFLQIAIAKNTMLDVLKEFNKTRVIETIEIKQTESKLYYNPTVFQYLYYLIKRKIK